MVTGMRDVIRRVMETAGHIIPVLLPLVPAVFLGIIVFAGTGHSTGTAKPDEYKVSAAKVDWDTFSLSDPGSGDGDDQAAGPEGTGAVNQEDGNRTFTDGTYRGSAQGYGGLVTVDVTVSGGRIESIEIVSAPGETDTFFNRAKGVIDSILMAQNTDVDVVSGATYSSNGIIAAVENALYGKTSRSLPSPGAASAKTGSAPSVAKVDESGSYKDGTYTGSAKGFGGQIKVQVTIKGGKIKTIKILSASGETSSYLNKAKSLLKRMVSRQSTNVDTVSHCIYRDQGDRHPDCSPRTPPLEFLCGDASGPPFHDDLFRQVFLRLCLCFWQLWRFCLFPFFLYQKETEEKAFASFSKDFRCLYLSEICGLICHPDPVYLRAGR